jgi:hypothetical protein
VSIWGRFESYKSQKLGQDHGIDCSQSKITQAT